MNSIQGGQNRGSSTGGELHTYPIVSGARVPFHYTVFLKHYIRDCFKVRSYCQCIIATVIDGLTGGAVDATPLNVFASFGNSAIFLYNSVNTEIVLHPVAIFSV